LILMSERPCAGLPDVFNLHSSAKMAHEYAVSREAFEKVTQTMRTQVSIPISGRHNALYDEKDLHHALIELSISNGYAESGMKGLALEAAASSSERRVPSGSWVRDMVEGGGVPEAEMREKLDRALASTLDQVKVFKLFAVPVMAAIDKHDLPRYDKDVDKGFLRRGKRKDGTTRFETYATLQCVEEGRRAQIACQQTGLFAENADVVESLVTASRLEGVRVFLLLVDREFFSSRVMNRMYRLRQRFLMPCRLTSGVKRALEEYAQGKRGMISRYALNPSAREEGVEPASFNLVILPRRGCEEGETDPVKRFIPFATNMPLGDILWNVRRVPEDYRRRWGIESGYVGVERLRARTTSRNHSLRLLYFYYSLILYNAWLLANLQLAKTIFRLPLMTEPSIPLRLMTAVFHQLVLRSPQHEAGGGG
jgi:hypothetical protein